MKPLRLYRLRVDKLAARVEAEVAFELASSARAAAEVAQRLMDTELARSAAGASGPLPACTAGCSFCCHVHVEATLPELYAIAAFLQENMAAAALAALEQKLAQRVSEVDALSDEARWAARAPCALLDADGRCSVYPVRPLRCRAFHSCSLEACHAAFTGASDEEPPQSRTLAQAADAVEAGYNRALASAGQGASVRLERGLLEHWPRDASDANKA